MKIIQEFRISLTQADHVFQPMDKIQGNRVESSNV